jgi:hypothetical protein
LFQEDPDAGMKPRFLMRDKKLVPSFADLLDIYHGKVEFHALVQHLRCPQLPVPITTGNSCQ